MQNRHQTWLLINIRYAIEEINEKVRVKLFILLDTLHEDIGDIVRRKGNEY